MPQTFVLGVFSTLRRLEQMEARLGGERDEASANKYHQNTNELHFRLPWIAVRHGGIVCIRCEDTRCANVRGDPRNDPRTEAGSIELGITLAESGNLECDDAHGCYGILP